MLDVIVLEAADDVDDGIHFPDVGQELVPQAFTLTGAFDQSGDSRNSTVAGTVRSGLTILARASSRGSGTWTTPVLGSMVAKG